jgi:hypothetical protein
MYASMSRSRRAHLATGTVQVTAVGIFGNGGGYAIAPPTLASLLLVVGGVSQQPRAIGDRVEIRDILDLTLTIDHNVVDGSRPPDSPPTYASSCTPPLYSTTKSPATLPSPHKMVATYERVTPPLGRGYSPSDRSLTLRVVRRHLSLWTSLSSESLAPVGSPLRRPIARPNVAFPFGRGALARFGSAHPVGRGSSSTRPVGQSRQSPW